MRKILTLTLASAITFTLIGCGGSDSKETDPKDVVLNYDKNSTSAKYDLSDYMFNKKGKILNYVRTIHTNKDGKKDYKNLDANTTYYSVKTDINATKIDEYKNEKLDTENIIYDKKIKIVSDGTAIDMVRYADNGDYIIKKTDSDTEEGIAFDTVLLCKVDKHIETITINNNTFNDLLKVTCKETIKSQDGQSFHNQLIEYDQQIDIVKYLAKDYGEVKNTTESCDTSKFGDKSSSECEQDISEITTIN
jgi:hypothetical protein